MLNWFAVIVLGLVTAQDVEITRCSEDTNYLCENFAGCVAAGAVEADAEDVLCFITASGPQEFGTTMPPGTTGNAATRPDPTGTDDNNIFPDSTTVPNDESTAIGVIRTTAVPRRSTTAVPRRSTTIPSRITSIPTGDEDDNGDDNASEDDSGDDNASGDGEETDALDQDANLPVFITPMKNQTRPEGSTVELRCGATNVNDVIITKLDLATDDNPAADTPGKPNEVTQLRTYKNIQAIPDEGWYRCKACNRYGCSISDSYLRVGSLCDGVTCPRTTIPRENFEENICECGCQEQCTFDYQPRCTNYCTFEFNDCRMFLAGCTNEWYDIDTLNDGQCPQIEEASIIDISKDSGGLGHRLTCKVAGSPQPEVTWYEEGFEVGSGEVLELPENAEGFFYCEAVNCNKFVARSVEIEILAQLEQAQPVATCQITGRSNIITYDQVSYSIVGACDYVAAMDCDNYEWFVYTRSRECGDNKEGTCVATVTAIVGPDMVEMLRGWIVNYGGKKVQPKDSPNEWISLENGFTLHFDGAWLQLTKSLNDNQSANLTIYWDGYTNVIIQSPYETGTCGLCGNNDDDDSNDFTPRAATEDVPPAEYAEAWKLDRRNVCKETQEPLELDAVCSEEDRTSASALCNDIMSSDNFDYCLNDFMESCIRDQCLGQVTPDIDPACVVAKAYAKQCYVEQFRLEGTNYIPYMQNAAKDWNTEGKCPTDEESLPIILDQGCPQM